MNITRVLKGIVFSVVLFFPVLSLAQAPLGDDITKQFKAAGTKGGIILADEKGNELDARVAVAEIIKSLLELVGVVFMVIILYAGYLRLTSHGEEERIKKSTSVAIAAGIGAIIIIFSYGITVFVTERLYNAATFDAVYETNDQFPNKVYEKKFDL